MTTTQVANYLRITDKHITRWLRKMGIPYTCAYTIFDGKRDVQMPSFVHPLDVKKYLDQLNPGEQIDIPQEYL